MYLCPNCQYQIQDYELNCPACDLDVREYAIAHEVSDRLYNEAMRALGQNDLLSACMKCNAALMQRPSDKGLWLLLGITYARMNALTSARQCFQTVAYFDRFHETAQILLKRVEALLGNTNDHIGSSCKQSLFQ